MEGRTGWCNEKWGGSGSRGRGGRGGLGGVAGGGVVVLLRMVGGVLYYCCFLGGCSPSLARVFRLSLPRELLARARGLFARARGLLATAALSLVGVACSLSRLRGLGYPGREGAHVYVLEWGCVLDPRRNGLMLFLIGRSFPVDESVGR